MLAIFESMSMTIESTRPKAAAHECPGRPVEDVHGNKGVEVLVVGEGVLGLLEHSCRGLAATSATARESDSDSTLARVGMGEGGEGAVWDNVTNTVGRSSSINVLPGLHRPQSPHSTTYHYHRMPRPLNMMDPVPSSQQLALVQLAVLDKQPQ